MVVDDVMATGNDDRLNLIGIKKIVKKNVEKSATLRLNDRLVSGGMEVIKRLGSVQTNNTDM
ncbi:unnamed protein product [Brassica rapa]|uniref:Uncharacterized protein n=3 Tax=Brassica TaxID=3705 RepID=A0A8D9MFV2_BRACM|nr:unnamed protein product [Brassica napus]CAG7907990.1 unnamed protein product [Brassica rapa]